MTSLITPLAAPIATTMPKLAVLFGPLPRGKSIPCDFAFIRFNRIHLATRLMRVRHQGAWMTKVTVVANVGEIGACETFDEHHCSGHLFHDDTIVCTLPGFASFPGQSDNRFSVARLLGLSLSPQIPSDRVAACAAALLQDLYLSRILTGDLQPVLGPGMQIETIAKVCRSDWERLTGLVSSSASGSQH